MPPASTAPHYRGALRTVLTANTPFDQVLTAAAAHRRTAQRSGSAAELAAAELALAEAHRRLGDIQAAERAWKASYRAARGAADPAGMAWALWCGGTLARQRGDLTLSRRWLSAAVAFAELGDDADALGHARAGYAETGRIQGDYGAVLALHEEELGIARQRADHPHAVWALLGIAQIYRNTGKLDQARALFDEAADTAVRADYRSGHAWAQRGIADLLSAQGDTDLALELLTEAEHTCRELRQDSALGYNLKMRGNVFYRAGRYPQALHAYREAHQIFLAMGEQRGAALAHLGLAKARAHCGRPPHETAADLRQLRDTFGRIGLRHARDAVDRTLAEFGLTV
ncbi:tetratricopeptide repeat protein [Streptomyces sp. SBC-4]|nr:tetratricopeptide repeat protein [Streptomyces sp. SBC-4]MDV5145417.1 tetratricopeptide repeat protein [Streptomyces sp. SBC-4]